MLIICDSIIATVEIGQEQSQKTYFCIYSPSVRRRSILSLPSADRVFFRRRLISSLPTVFWFSLPVHRRPISSLLTVFWFSSSGCTDPYLSFYAYVCDTRSYESVKCADFLQSTILILFTFRSIFLYFPFFLINARFAIVMAENSNQTPSVAQLNAPSYSELFKLVTDLQKKIRSLKDNSTSSSTTPEKRTKGEVKYHILSNLDKSISTFTG